MYSKCWACIKRGSRSPRIMLKTEHKTTMKKHCWIFMLSFSGLKNREERERQYFDTGLPATSSALMNEDVVEDDELYDRVSQHWPDIWYLHWSFSFLGQEVFFGIVSCHSGDKGNSKNCCTQTGPAYCFLKACGCIKMVKDGTSW